MAKRKGNGKANGTAEPKGKKKSDVPKIGHNRAALEKSANRHYGKYAKILREKEKLSGAMMSDAKVIIEGMANETGATRRVCRTTLQEKWREEKRQKKERDLEPDEKSSLNTMRGALGLPLFDFAVDHTLGDEGDDGNTDGDTGGDGEGAQVE